MNVAVIGAGVAGLTCAAELADRGMAVSIFERGESVGEQSCSWYAGGMLAPWCEQESAEPDVVQLGLEAAQWWSDKTGLVTTAGSLVLSPKRDLGELRQFARKTAQYEWVDSNRITQLEPDLGGRFEQGLYFATESHLSPREALSKLVHRLGNQQVNISFGESVNPEDLARSQDYTYVVDCRGFCAVDKLNQLRGVKGEMLILNCDQFSLSRSVRLLHPRYPMYLVPRGTGQFMLGASMIESENRDGITARSMLELLSAAYALHPVLAESEILEIGVDVRPAFSDNLPCIVEDGKIMRVNGLFRHGFLLGPAMARKLADRIGAIPAEEVA